MNNVNNMMLSEFNNCESLIQTSDYDNLFYAMQKCKGNGVGWKPDVQSFVKNGCTNCCNLSEQLMNLTYEVGPYRYYEIFEPTKRSIVAMYMKDRVVHRSFSDNYFYDKLTRSFIYDNFACQKGKGPDKARKRYKAHLQRYYRKHGFTGYIMKLDIHSFFGSIPHSVIMDMLSNKLDAYGIYFVEQVIDKYHTSIDPITGDKIGIFLGSIITQLLGINTLNELDHIIKEIYHIEDFLRYNDDMIFISYDKQQLIDLFNFITDYLKSKGLTLNNKKSKIYRISDKVEFLGFNFRLTDTGYVVMTVPKRKVKYKKRKLRNMINACVSGKIPRETVDNHLESYIEYISHSNSNKLIYSLRKYYDKLWEDVLENV